MGSLICPLVLPLVKEYILLPVAAVLLLPPGEDHVYPEEEVNVPLPEAKEVYKHTSPANAMMEFISGL